MLFKSLICLRGCDLGWRHLLISGAAYLSLMLLWLLFGSRYFIWLPGMLLLLLVLATSVRRMRDAGRPLLIAAVAILPWLLVLAALSTEGVDIYFNIGLGLAVLLHLGLAFIPAVAGSGAINRREYLQGYAGPVDLSPKTPGRRVEPTIGATAAVATVTTTTITEPYGQTFQTHDDVALEPQIVNEAVAADTNMPEDSSWQEPSPPGSLSAMLSGWQQIARDLMQQAWQYRKALSAFVAVLVCITMALVWWFSPSAAPKVDAPLQAMDTAQPSVKRQTVKLPDHFSLSLEQDNLYLSWLGDTLKPGVIWDLASATGDQRCAALQFNDGSQFRPLKVSIINGNGLVEAAFSPLDTKALINDIAMRGSIKLCGYDFSLKGSQAALQADNAFSQYLK